MPLTVLTPSTQLEIPHLPTGPINALYVHVPFCVHKCHYCDFYSITRQGEDRMSLYVDLLLREAEHWKDRAFQPVTVFFGGGTPSLLPPELMDRLLSGLHARMDLSAVREWTVEVNPATSREASFDLSYAAMLKRHGVTRLSLGAQSFDPAELRVLERHHHPEDVPHTLQIARSAGFQRLSVDLIFALPGQTMTAWEANLEKAIELGTEHVSCYALTYEANTPMTTRLRRGEFLPTEDDLEVAMLRHTRSRLAQADLPPYEVSNFGQPCQHNLIYWTGGSYIALGPSASGHVHGVRWKNHANLGAWERSVQMGVHPAAEVERLSPQQRAGERAMLNLRLARGIDRADFAAATGIDPLAHWQDVIDPLVHNGLIDLSTHHIVVTDKGLPVLDAIAAEFLQSPAAT